MIRWLAAVMLFAACFQAQAQDRAEQDRRMVERAAEIAADPAASVPEDLAAQFRSQATAPPVSDEDRASFEALRDQALRIQREGLEATPDSEERHAAAIAEAKSKTVLLFVSQSMGEAGLKAALESVRGEPDAAIVLRGMVKGQTIGQLQRMLLRLAGPVDPEGRFPGMMIDPTLFSRYGVDVAPTLVYVDQERALATARGLTTLGWFRDRIKDGRRGDLGQHGETSEVTEEDMLEALKAAAAKRDWSQDREAAFRSHWDKLEYLDLQVAERDRVREVDPSFVVTEGITAPDGTVIAYAGQRFNPLDAAPFRQVLVVFDATDPAQRPIVDAAIREAGDRRVTLITTRYTRESGFEGLGTLWEDFGRPVYLLQRDVRERFAIERVPSIVQAQGRVMLVREVAVR